MKSYGAKKATEFNKKDLASIYKAAKIGELKVEKWFMNKLYELADYYGFDDNGTVASMESDVLSILSSCTQEKINEITNKWFEYYSKNFQNNFDRNFVK